MSRLTSSTLRFPGSAAGRFLSWLWLGLAVLGAADVLWRGEGQPARVAVAALVAISAVVWVIGLRPAVLADDDRVILRNPLRDVVLPWGAVTAIEAGDTLRVRSGDRVFRSWAVQAGNGERFKAYRPRRSLVVGRSGLPVTAEIEAGVHGRTHADFVVEQLDAVWRRRRTGTPGAPRVVWSRTAGPAVLAPSAALLLTLLLR